MWNDVCVDQGQDAIHGCSVVVLTAGGGFKAGKFHTVVLTRGLLQSQVLFVYKKRFVSVASFFFFLSFLPEQSTKRVIILQSGAGRVAAISLLLIKVTSLTL